MLIFLSLTDITNLLLLLDWCFFPFPLLLYLVLIVFSYSIDFSGTAVENIMSLSFSVIQGEENFEENKAKVFAFSSQECRSSTRVKRRDDDQ